VRDPAAPVLAELPDFADVAGRVVEPEDFGGNFAAGELLNRTPPLPDF
jgi:hypothetical protein